jgi:hypothetical protein
MKTPEDEAFEEIERIQRTRTRWVPVNKPQDEIFAMAKEAGFMQHLGVICIPNVQNLEDFAKLVAAKEREACAKVADGWPDYDVQGLAEAIRARGQA